MNTSPWPVLALPHFSLVAEAINHTSHHVDTLPHPTLSLIAASCASVSNLSSSLPSGIASAAAASRRLPI